MATRYQCDNCEEIIPDGDLTQVSLTTKVRMGALPAGITPGLLRCDRDLCRPCAVKIFPLLRGVVQNIQTGVTPPEPP